MYVLQNQIFIIFEHGTLKVGNNTYATYFIHGTAKLASQHTL